MAAHTKFMIGAGIAIAGLGLIGAGAGATFTAQVSAESTISAGGLGLSLNGQTGSDVHLDLDGKNLSSHFKPISKDLRLKNTGTLDMVSTYLSLTATGCKGGDGERLAKALHLKLTDETNDDLVYQGDLCSFAIGKSEHGDSPQGAENAGTQSGRVHPTPPAHAGVGGRLPHALEAGESILYRIVIQPKDAEEGLPSEAQFTHTTVKLVFSGFDY